MKPNTKPLTERVYQAIYDEIINGTITGNDILTESVLIEKYQTSRSPVREALILLCEEDILRVIPRTGYRVVSITPAQVTSLIEAREVLETSMLQKAWSSIGEVQIEQLERAREACKKDELINTSITANWHRNISFHLLLAGFSGNEYLEESLRRILGVCARTASQYFLNVRGIPKGDQDEHDRIVEAIRMHDYEKTLEALRKDIRQIL